MFLRSLARFAIRIPSASTARFMDINKIPNIHVIEPLSSSGVQLRLFSTEKRKVVKPNTRERLYEKIFELDGSPRRIEICHSPEEGYNIFISHRGYVFLTPQQAKLVIENLDQAANLKPGEKIENTDDGLFIHRRQSGVIVISSDQMKSRIHFYSQEELATIKAYLIETTNTYDKLVTEGRINI